MGGHRKIGKPKLRWSDVAKKYMKEKGVNIEEAQYRRMWRLKTVLISRRAYLNLDLLFTCRSCTGPCLGLPALIHICLIFLDVSYKSSTYSAHAGLYVYYYMAYAFV